MPPSISSISLGSSSLSSAYSNSSTDSEYEEIKRKLLALGIAPSGNKSVDKAKLENAEKSQKQQKSQGANQSDKAVNSSAQKQEVPQELKEILNQLGLTSSGKVDEDCAKAQKKIQQELATSTDESQKNKLRQLKNKLEIFMAKTQGSNSSGSVMLGASALADLNRQMLLG